MTCLTKIRCMCWVQQSKWIQDFGTTTSNDLWWFKFQKALGLMNCKGWTIIIEVQGSTLQSHAQTTIGMATSTLKKKTIIKDQNTMASFMVLDSKFVLEEAKEYFVFQKREELGKLQVRFQPTTIIPTNVSPPKKILYPTTPHGHSQENEYSLTFDSSPTQLQWKDLKSQNSPQNSPSVSFWKCNLISFKKWVYQWLICYQWTYG